MQDVSLGLWSNPVVSETSGPQSNTLSAGEYRLWFLEHLFPGTPRYHVHCGIRFTGRLDVPRLERCILHLFEKHPILRASYPKGSTGPRRVITPHIPRTVPFCDLSAYPPERRDAIWEQLELAQARKPFDLESGPLYRHVLVRFSENEHCWVMTQHHTITDGWSIGLIFREIAALYASDDVATQVFSTRDEVTNPVSRRHGYEQFVAWERNEIEHPNFEQHLAYWRQRLAGVANLNLPGDLPSSKERTGRGDIVRFQLDAAATSRVQRLSESLGVTRFPVLLAAFATLLGRFARQDDFVVAVPHAGVARRRFIRDLGFFVNTIPVRCQLQGGASFADQVRALARAFREDLGHAHVPFDRIVEALSVPREGLNPLTQVGFVMNQAWPKQKVGEVELSSYLRTPDAAVEGGTKFDLGLSIGQDGDTLVGAFEFDTDLFDRDTIERLAARYQRLLESVAAQPDTPVSAYALLSDAELNIVMEQWTATDMALPQARTVIDLLADAFRRFPENVALRFGEKVLTYAQLDVESNRVASLLRRRGVGVGALVGVMLDRTPEMVAALLGILKAGAAYLPLDPEYPSGRIAFMLEDSATRCALTTSTLVRNLPSSQLETILLDVDAAEIEFDVPWTTRADTTAEDLAYVIYTSGSTGRPKGVEITHGSLCNFLSGMRLLLTPDSTTKTLALASLSFDITTLELFLPLLVGGEVAIATRDEARDPRALCAVIEQYGTTLVQATPATWRMLVESGLVTKPTMTLLTGGEALGPDLARRLTASGASLWNVYGPTETTVWCTAWRVPHDAKRMRIGKPIANVQIYVVDQQGAPVPIGVPGELLIGGAGVGRGYRGRDELTAERFVPNPFAPHRSPRLYRTGDFGRWLADGTLELLGRMDDQIKLRGHRLELGEIERSLEEHAGVSAASCLVHASALEDRQLIAFVVPRADAIAKDENEDWRRHLDDTHENPRESGKLIAELTQYLRQRLPSYMVPTRIVSLEALPLTANGKVDRRVLASYAIHTPSARAQNGEARTECEAGVVRAFQRVLGLEQVGRGDSFFELGGDSLSAVRLVAELEMMTGRTLSLSTVLRAATPERIAELLDHDKAGQTGVDLEQEATLGDDVRVTTGAARSPARPRVLLTGATGFLGAFLLRDLLERTNCEVVCLVRAHSDEEGMRRIQKSLRGFGLSLENHESRVRPLVGDLARPRLGLSLEDFNGLSTEVDSIYHCGATVHLTQGYEELRDANVAGTHEIIRLACAGAPKHLHYVSTVGVYSTRYEGMAVTEDDDAEDWRGLVGGYQRTKWVAERIVRKAVNRGLKATVYRPGFVTGDSQTGAWNGDDFVGIMLRETIRLGVVPVLDDALDMTPVDYVSAAIVQLAEKAEGNGEVFHLVNSSPIPLSELVAWIRRRGYAVASLSFDEWRSRLASSPDDTQARLLLAIVENLRPARPHGGGWTGGPGRFLCPATLRALEGSGVLCPPIDDTLLRCYFDYFESRGWVHRA